MELFKLNFTIFISLFFSFYLIGNVKDLPRKRQYNQLKEPINKQISNKKTKNQESLILQNTEYSKILIPIKKSYFHIYLLLYMLLSDVVLKFVFNKYYVNQFFSTDEKYKKSSNGISHIIFQSFLFFSQNYCDSVNQGIIYFTFFIINKLILFFISIALIPKQHLTNKFYKYKKINHKLKINYFLTIQLILNIVTLFFEIIEVFIKDSIDNFNIKHILCTLIIFMTGFFVKPLIEDMKKEKFLFIYEKLKIEDYNEENSKTVYNKTEFIKFVKNGSIKVLDNNFKLEDFIKRSKNYL